MAGCSEEAGLAVNVLGTRTLLRYLVDRGCKHFVLASSIAAVGCGSEGFLPRELPIPDDHPCDAIDVNGLSKALMEEVAFYLHRQNPELEITLFRLGAILSDVNPSLGNPALTETTLPFLAGGGVIALSDAIEAFVRAASHRLGPGIRRLNLVGRESRTTIPVPDALRLVLGERAERLDLSWYAQAGREAASLYAVEGLWETYGFRPAIDVRTSNPPRVAGGATPEAS